VVDVCTGGCRRDGYCVFDGEFFECKSRAGKSCGEFAQRVGATLAVAQHQQRDPRGRPTPTTRPSRSPNNATLAVAQNLQFYLVLLTFTFD